MKLAEICDAMLVTAEGQRREGEYVDFIRVCDELAMEECVITPRFIMLPPGIKIQYMTPEPPPMIGEGI